MRRNLKLCLVAASVLVAPLVSAQSTIYWSGHLSPNWYSFTNEEGTLLDANWVASPGAVPNSLTVRTPDIDTIVSFSPASLNNLPNTNASADGGIIYAGGYRVSGVRTEAGLNSLVNVNGDITGQNFPLNIHGSGISYNGNSGLQFNSPVVLNGNQTWHVGPGNIGLAYIGFFSTLTGTGTITKTGAGTVQFSSNNSAFSGTYLQTDGSTQLTSGSTLANTNVNLTSGLLTIDSNNSFATLSGSGNATIRPVGLSPLNLTIGTDGTNAPDTTYGGNLTNNTVIPASTLSLTIASAPTRRVQFLSKTGGATYSGATTIRSGAFIATTAPNALSPNSPVVVEANGNLDIGGHSQSIPSLQGGGRVYSFGPTGAVLTVGSSNASTTFSGTFINAGGAGTFGLTKVGTGTLTLSNIHTYTGPTTVSGGTLEVSAVSDGANRGLNLTSSVTINSGATLRLLSRNAYAGNRGNLPPLTINSGGTVTTANGVAVTLSTVNLSGGTLTGGTPDPAFGNYVINSAINVNTDTTLTVPQIQLNGTVTVNTADSTSLNLSSNLANVFGGTGSLTKAGGGTLVFNRNHSFTGPVTINGGPLSVVDLATLPNAVTINAGSLRLGNGPSDSRGNATGPITINTGGTLVLAAASSTGPVTNNGLIRTDPSGPFSIASAISGTGSLQHTGADVLYLTGNNTYTGPTTVTNRILVIGNGGPTGSIVSNVSLTNSSSTLIFDRTTASTYPGNISGSGDVYLYGQGPITFTGNNSAHTGRTYIAGGTLQIGSDTSVGPGPINITSGGLRAAFASRLVPNTINLDGSLTLGRSTFHTGTFNISGNSAVVLNNPDGPANDPSGIANLTAVGPNPTLSISAGPAGIGAAFLNISGTGSFNGSTSINTTVRFGSTSPLPNSPISINPGGRLLLPIDTSVTSLSTAAATNVPTALPAGELSFQSNLTLTGAGDSNLLGHITGTGTLTKTGPGSLFLAGTYAPSGGIALVLNASTTTIGSPLTNSASISLNGAATLSVLASGNNTVVTRALSIAPVASVNLRNNDLLLNYTNASPIATLINYFQSGQLTADQDAGGLPTTLAISEAADLGLTSYAGLAVDETTVIVKYTYVGDANLDGQVDALDYERIDLAIGNTGVFGTAQGDLNYDGNVDALDYEQVDLNIGNGVGQPLGSGSQFGGVFIPEPSTLGLIGLFALGVRRRR